MMSTSEAPKIERPPRSLSSPTLGLRLLSLDFGRQIRARKTLTLVAIQLLPVVIAAVFVIWRDVDGMNLFRNTIEHVYIPLLLPLAALFFGGPTIVNEIEGRTITYLTLRPLSRATLFLAKLASSISVALVATLLPVLALFGVCMIGSGDPLGDSLPMLGAALGAVAVGAITYTAIFAFLGVLFSATLLLGIVYFVVVELVFAAIPIIELLSVKFHLRTIAGFTSSDRAGFLDRLILEEPLNFEWWFGVLIAGLMASFAIIVSTLVFRQRQFHV